MINLTTAENALKTAYLGAITDILNTKTNPFLSRIKQTSEGVSGKEIVRAVNAGMIGGIGAGTEDGELPKSGGNKYVQFKSTLKNLYGQIEISDKAIRASANGDGAFVDLLNAETESLVNASKFNLGRMLYGDGSGKIDDVTLTSASTYEVYPYNIGRFLPGMEIEIFNPLTSQTVLKTMILSIDYSAGALYVDKQLSSDGFERYEAYLSGSKGLEILGVEHLFNKTGPLYGVNRSGIQTLMPISIDAYEFSDEVVQSLLDSIEIKSGSTPDIILCSYEIRRRLIEFLSAYKRNIDVVNLEGGFKAISYNGIPVVADRHIERNTMYFFNTADFKLHQLCDWTWLENENGKILHQTQGKPTYTATLVKYAELICDRPNAQGKLVFHF